MRMDRRAAPGWREWAEAECEAIREAEQWRVIRDFDADGPEGHLAASGKRVVSFASNDYLGLAGHPQVRAAARAALDRWGGSGRGAADRRLASSALRARGRARELKGAERALLFPTGFAANLAVLATFGGRRR